MGRRSRSKLLRRMGQRQSKRLGERSPTATNRGLASDKENFEAKKVGLNLFVDFFIRRPVFATVCALLIILGGAISIPSLPIAQFPDLAPPQVVVSSAYIGANAQTVESAVTIPLEQAINGVQGMKYITSSSGNDGTSQITVTFDVSRRRGSGFGGRAEPREPGAGTFAEHREKHRRDHHEAAGRVRVWRRAFIPKTGNTTACF